MSRNRCSPTRTDEEHVLSADRPLFTFGGFGTVRPLPAEPDTVLADDPLRAAS